MDENYSKLADIAYNMHVSGKLEDAKSVYEKLLTINPDDLNVLNLYAQLNAALKNHDKALEIFNKVYEKTKLDDVLINIAKVYISKQEYKEAVCSLNKVNSKTDSLYRLLALAYIKQSCCDLAVETYHKIQKTDYNDLYNLSTAYLMLNKNGLALEYALKSYSVNKTDIDLLNRIALLYKKAGDDVKAVDFFIKVLELKPNDKNSLINIAVIYKKHDKNKSVEILENLKETYPDDIAIQNYLYVMYIHADMIEKAYELSVELINKDETNYYYYSIAGDSLLDLYRYEEAEKMYRKALSLNPEKPEYIVKQLSHILSVTNRSKEALEILKNYLYDEDCMAGYAYIQWRNRNLSETREIYYNWVNQIESDSGIEDKAKMLFYKFDIGKRYNITEDAFLANKDKTDKKSIREKYSLKSWKDEDITNKRLFVYSANGVGDLVMFSRYLNKLKNITSKLIIKIPSSCVSLFKYNFPDIQITTDNIGEDEYDYNTTFMKLLYNLRIDLKNIEYSSPYLSVDEDLISEKSKLKEMKVNKKKAGIYWQGNPSTLVNRSISLEYFLPLFNIENIQLYSFQISNVDYKSDELKKTLPLIDLAPHIKDYADTAAFLKNIDTLITIDTSIANLAGALGVKTYLLLPFDSEWRWFYDTKTTPWYDSIKIFKQKIPADWGEVIQRVKNELEL